MIESILSHFARFSPQFYWDQLLQTHLVQFCIDSPSPLPSPLIKKNALPCYHNLISLVLLNFHSQEMKV